MRNNIGLLLIALCALASCQREDETTSNDWKVSIDAIKGDVGTRALAVEGSALNATWTAGDEVTVTKNGTQVGTLTAKTNGVETALEGTLTGPFSTTDVLTLAYLNPDYTGQDGTLDYIATHCDYALANVSITSVSGGVLVTSPAQFANQQSITGFSFTDGTSALLPTSLIISAASGKLVQKYQSGSPEYGDITVEPGSTCYVALRNESGESDTYSFIATVGNHTYTGEKQASLTNGNYYATTVTLAVVPVPVTGVSLDHSTLSLEKGSSFTLNATISPEDATSPEVSWESSNASVATVDDQGNVTAVAGGTATITVTTADGNMTAECIVTVTVPVTSIALYSASLQEEVTSLTMFKGDSDNLSIVCYPVDATDKADYLKASNQYWNFSHTYITGYNGNIRVDEDCQTGTYYQALTVTAKGKSVSLSVTVIDPTPATVDLGLSVYWGDKNYHAGSSVGFGTYYSATEAIVKGFSGGWRLPTKDEVDELISNCTWAQSTVSGVEGYTASNNGKTIFLPKAGMCLDDDTSFANATHGGYYWASTFNSGYYRLRLGNSTPEVTADYLQLNYDNQKYPLRLVKDK